MSYPLTLHTSAPNDPLHHLVSNPCWPSFSIFSASFTIFFHYSFSQQSFILKWRFKAMILQNRQLSYYPLKLHFMYFIIILE